MDMAFEKIREYMPEKILNLQRNMQEKLNRKLG